MDELIGRLRGMHQALGLGNGSACQVAADELERLRAQNHQVRAELSHARHIIDRVRSLRVLPDQGYGEADARVVSMHTAVPVELYCDLYAEAGTEWRYPPEGRHGTLGELLVALVTGGLNPDE